VAQPTHIETTRTPSGEWTISLAGEIGPWDALVVDEELLDVLDRDGRDVVVDLDRVTALDPVAVRVLSEGAERQREAGGELYVAAGDRSRRGRAVRPVVAAQLGRLAGLSAALDRALRDRRIAVS
jgi:anti-anti-sigma regulatory factor